MAELVTGPENPGPIKIPEWDNVLHIASGPRLTQREAQAWANWYAPLGQQTATLPSAERAKRVREAGENRPPAAGMLGLDYLAVKIRRAQETEDSAVPGWRRKLIVLMTAADNLEDIVSTVNWITRPLQAVIPGGRAIGAVLRGTSDVLNRVQTVMRGPSIVGRSNKSKAERERRKNARTSKPKLKGPARIMQWAANNYGNLLQAGQASDTVFGVGIQLGGIFGAIEETQDRAWLSAWHAGKSIIASTAALVPGIPGELATVLREQGEASREEVRRVGAPLVAQIEREIGRVGRILRPLTPLGIVEDAQDAVNSIRTEGFGSWLARAARGAATVQTSNDFYSRGDHAAALYLSALAAAPLATALHYAHALAPQLELQDLVMPAPRVSDPLTRAVLEARGARFDARGRGLGEWAQPTQSVVQWVSDRITEASAARATWLPAGNQEDHDQFLHALVEAHRPTSSLLLTGAVDAIGLSYEPAVRAEMMLYHLGTYPPRDVTDQAIAAWLADQVEEIERHPEDYDERAAARITARHWPLPPAFAA